MRCQNLAGFLPDLTNSEGAEKLRKTVLLTLFKRSHQVFCAFTSHALQIRNTLRLQIVELCRCIDETRIDESFTQAHSETVNIHRISGSKMNNIAKTLRRTLCSGTAQCNAVLIAFDRRSAFRTNHRHFVRHCVSRALVLVDRKHLGDDLAGFLHQNSIADPKIQIVDEILIMKRGIRDGSAGKTNGIDHSLGSQHTRSANLNKDLTDDAFFLFWRIFIGNRPTGEFSGASQCASLRKIIDFNDRAVNIKREFAAIFTDPIDAITAGLQRIAFLIWYRRESERFQIIQRICMRRKRTVGA